MQSQQTFPLLVENWEKKTKCCSMIRRPIWMSCDELLNKADYENNICPSVIIIFALASCIMLCKKQGFLSLSQNIHFYKG